MVLTAASMFQGYHTLVPGNNSIFRDGMGPSKSLTLGSLGNRQSAYHTLISKHGPVVIDSKMHNIKTLGQILWSLN